ncbi:MAG TPA: hypothetical protein V6D20_13345 [Candidatus Obscuribacterales bacterium]
MRISSYGGTIEGHIVGGGYPLIKVVDVLEVGIVDTAIGDLRGVDGSGGVDVFIDDRAIGDFISTHGAGSDIICNDGIERDLVRGDCIGSELGVAYSPANDLYIPGIIKRDISGYTYGVDSGAVSNEDISISIGSELSFIARNIPDEDGSLG